MRQSQIMDPNIAHLCQSVSASMDKRRNIKKAENEQNMQKGKKKKYFFSQSQIWQKMGGVFFCSFIPAQIYFLFFLGVLGMQMWRREFFGRKRGGNKIILHFFPGSVFTTRKRKVRKRGERRERERERRHWCQNLFQEKIQIFHLLDLPSYTSSSPPKREE